VGVELAVCEEVSRYISGKELKQ